MKHALFSDKALRTGLLILTITTLTACGGGDGDGNSSSSSESSLGSSSSSSSSLDSSSSSVSSSSSSSQSSSSTSSQSSSVSSSVSSSSSSSSSTSSVAAKIKLYQHCDYTGWIAEFAVGEFTTSAITGAGALNNDASSLKIPSGFEVKLYDNDNFTGTPVILTRDTPCLVEHSFNDKTSSMHIATRDVTWNSVAIPTVEYINDGGTGGKEFTKIVPDINPYIHDIAQGVVKILYKTPQEVPAFSTLELHIENWDDDVGGVAWASGSKLKKIVNVNGYHLERIKNQGGNVADEVTGVLYHELTHAYQHSRSGVASPAIEGLADAVRYKAGYVDIGFRGRGGSWESSYKTTGFFLAWIQDEKDLPDFLHDFNQQANPDTMTTPWSWSSAIENTTNQNLNNLWDEYQDWLLDH